MSSLQQRQALTPQQEQPVERQQQQPASVHSSSRKHRSVEHVVDEFSLVKTWYDMQYNISTQTMFSVKGCSLVNDLDRKQTPVAAL